MTRRLPVILVGQTPPPVHGQALAIERLVRANFTRVAIYHVPMDFSSTVEEIGRFQLRKIVRLFRLVWRVVRLRFVTRARILYYPPAGQALMPVIRDIVFLTLVRPFFPALVFDYHAEGLGEVEHRLNPVLRAAFRRSYYGATLAIDKYRPASDRDQVPARRRLVIPYGIEDELICTGPDVESQSPFTVLYVGLIAPSKGIWTLLESISILTGRGIEVNALVVGEFSSAEVKNEWDTALSRWGIVDRVEYKGRLFGAEKWNAFRRADVFCLPSHYENEALPISIIEAMQFCLPVVGSDWRGIPALVVEGQTGFVVPPRDPAALADRLACLSESPELRRRLGDAARNEYLDKYTLEAFLDAMEDALVAVGEELDCGVGTSAKPDASVRSF